MESLISWSKMKQQRYRMRRKNTSHIFKEIVSDWSSPDPEYLRTLIPENRKYGYPVMKVIQALCDTDSVLELRKDFARNMVTALVRIEGKPLGLIANNPRHLGGAIDSTAADKAARFLQLCDAFGLASALFVRYTWIHGRTRL